MTAPVIPAAAVEAAARAIARVRFDRPQPTCLEVTQRANEAQAAISAALPVLVEGIAEAIEATYLGADFGRNYDGTESSQTALGNAHDEALQHAAAIARAYGSSES